MKKPSLKNQLLAGVAGLALLGAYSTRADQQVMTSFELGMRVNANINAIDCNNSGGPEVTLDGDIELTGLKMKVIFKNNRKGTHTAVVVKEASVTLLPLGSSITIPKQPVRGGVGGNPHIYLQFNDGQGNPMSEEFYLGRCVQGLELSTDMVSSALALANIHAEGCTNRRGPWITLDGQLVMSGLNAKFIFRNNVKGTHTAEESREVTLILDGETIVLPKQPVRGGVGGNPIISIQFLNGDGSAIADPVELGRCVQL